jgi:hypothetical protein
MGIRAPMRAPTGLEPASRTSTSSPAPAAHRAVGPVAFLALLVPLALLAVAPPAGGSAPLPGQDFHAVLTPGREPTFVAPDATADLLAHDDHTVLWRIRTNLTALDGTIEIKGWFNVSRIRQVVPDHRTREAGEDGWRLFIPVDAATIPDRPAGARNANVTGTPQDITMRLAFPVDANSHEAHLRLRRDVHPPVYHIGQVRDATHFGFYVESTTDEPALATLWVRPADLTREPVPFPTTVASSPQRFPVQGLEPDRDHLFRIEFEDWAGNRISSPELPARTAAKPVHPAPTITAREPPPNATVAGPVRLVAVNFTGEGPTRAAHVAAFVDKMAQLSSNVTVLPGRVEVRLEPGLGPGFHSVGFDLRTAEGGLTEDSWTFTVAGKGASAPAAPTLVALALAAGAAVLVRNRRARWR